ncbi:hypothetical protein HELRODRAFT_77631 [Helobdella robusta]|uniref:Structure-specific endonuclease subunit SLX1 homolog n=1 Tax=Helobdella robusta TaxID=6412 RepID=T1G312_HELRO|nr:hypothetical protein HELRODRAFT_77631 [Helobdella robusta]ESO05775.1 hypothetical protein HELRODRAFT_77631 [Helobdella robusta]
MNFYGVYLLYCLNPKYRGRTYIGFTVNPNRRINQHNKGKEAGGAVRTHGKGPWEMVLIVHGFPNMISALQFEWAWTKPKLSRRLKNLPNKKAADKKYDYCINVLCHMVNTGPWNRLPLTIRWLKQEYKFSINVEPPLHMAIEHGPVKNVRRKVEAEENHVTEFKTQQCVLCLHCFNENDNTISCFHCNTSYHTMCLADTILNAQTSDRTTKLTKHLLPVDGTCPKCFRSILWGDLIRFKKGGFSEKCVNDTCFME